MQAGNIIQNIIGKKKRGKDSDGDGVINSRDCQPFNTMRQDKIAAESMGRVFGNLSLPQEGRKMRYRLKEEKLRGKI